MKKILLLTALYAFSIASLLYFNPAPGVVKQPINEKVFTKKQRFNGPEEFAKFHRSIRMAEGELKPGYAPGYKMRELSKAKARVVSARTKSNNGVLEWIERGPSNVPGRTRGLLVDPDDASRNIWFAGSAGGGVWKTTNGGTTWTLLTPDLPNLATTVLAMAASNTSVIYLGTGEGFFNLDAINGGGVFKSTNKGVSWTFLSSTLSFGDINRMVVSPANENIVVVATSLGIYRTTDGGINWTQVLNEGTIQDLKANPANFNILYAAQNSVGVWKSVDAGVTWTLSNNDMGSLGRVELAVSPVNTNRIFASCEESFGEGSKLLLSDDAGVTWSRVNVSFNNSEVDFLGGQGWYDNTIVCHPFNANVIYFGGVSIFQLTVQSGSTTINSYDVVETNTQGFMELVNFGAGFYNGTLDVGTESNANASVEIRFGPGRSQKAHRFLVPVNATSGVTDANYTYQDYVTVPFEVWDVTNNRQLMISFRDQGRDGAFNLISRNTESTVATEQSREYLFINNVTYNPTTPSSSITVNGGHIFNEMYNIWPVLAVGNTWNPGTLPAATFAINLEAKPLLNANTITSADVYSQFDGKNNFVVFGQDMHPDQHNLVVIPSSGSSFRILNANDGGIFISNNSANPGVNQGNWTMVGNTYNTSQFYGADKRTGFDEYFGGMQDNGTWKSAAGQTASASSQYLFNIGGDGFEVIWNNQNTNFLIGGSQGNGFRRSVDGGFSWTTATAGLSGTAPFITKLSNSRALPDRIFSVSSAGVFVSNNFGQNWTLTPITQKWGSGSLLDVEVSKANANIVWAGLGMSSALNLHVSVNGGVSFALTNNYTDVSMGGITRLASHPSEENSAYALFSAAGKPKILKTSNLGQSWTDISGFGTNNVSASGFPDVAVYCLYVRPDNTDILWAGTEIGIVESLDGGASWAILDDFPNVSVWDMKGVDDQVVIATHGRGIWTATISTPQSELPPLPEFVTMGTNPDENLSVLISSEETFDSLQVFIGEVYIGTIIDLNAGEVIVEISNTPFGQKTIKGIAFKGSAPFVTNSISGQHLDLKPAVASHADYFSNSTNFALSGFQLITFDEQGANERKTLHTAHNYPANSNFTAQLLVPITIASSNATFKYRDVAIIEPVNDFVVVEATRDGIHWLPISPSYNATFNTNWTTTFNTAAKGTYSQMVAHDINLLNTLPAGEKVLFRFRLSSNASIQAWGWAIDYVAIQEEPTEAEYKTVSSSASVYPNPTYADATVTYSISKASEVSIDIISTLGTRITRIQKGNQAAGTYSEKLITANLPTGTYLIVVRKSEGNEVVRFVVK